MIELTLNGLPVKAEKGWTLLATAKFYGIDIPTLCYNEGLTPFGGCRLCMVEIEGMRGYPLSCTTTVQEGMRVLTDTARLRELRKEILKLILSEHPSSCLVCAERAECQDYQGTIRKAGVSTGCRFCPNDGQCELQNLVEKIGVTEIDYPIYYHGYEAEHDDPFYDRDYNICILCGRCVRMCQEVRGSSVLAFTYRGPRAKVGPAFGRSHTEAGCEFCGACVDVCPTGALADKVSKWDGKPDRTFISTCPFCAIGCQIELDQKNGRLSKASANLDPEINDGQLCVKGRFCLPEVAHHFERAKKPMLQKGAYFREVAWPEALEKVAAEVKAVQPDEFVMLVSPDLTNESLFAAQKFVRDCLGSPNIDSTARLELAGQLGLWSKLFSLPISIKDIAKADAILAVGLDSRFNFSVVGTRVRKALDGGARLVTIDPRDSNLARYTDHWLRPIPGQEGLLLKFLADSLTGQAADLRCVVKESEVDAPALEKALGILSAGKDVAVIIGPQVFHYGDDRALVEALMTLAERKNVNFIPLYFGANTRGALEMGTFPEIGPGGVPRDGGGLGLVDIISGSRRPKVIYLVGDVPFFERPDCDFLIVQDIYLPTFQVDAFLPASSFAETEGTLVNIEGRVQEVVRVEYLPEGAVTGLMRPDWRIFADLAQALECPALHYQTTADVLKDIRAAVPGFPGGKNRRPRQTKAVDNLTIHRSSPGQTSAGAFLLVAEPGGYRHRGIDISSKVGGLTDLGLEEGFRMHPEDIEGLRLKNGDRINVSFDNGKVRAIGAVKPDIECPRKVIYYTRPAVCGGLKHRRGFWPLHVLRENPVRVDISPMETEKK